MRGVLSIVKPAGITSYDVIRALKKTLRPAPRAIGHAGTLDPMATGLLLVLLGEATRVSSLLLGLPKTYAATVLFGRATDTDDITGRTTEERPVPGLDRAGLDAALEPFRGTFQQTPPAYSAQKQNGQPLYRKARRGEPVAPRPRAVTVHRLRLLDWTPPRAVLELEVSAGTYIRAIARDLGRALGSAATLERLQRTRIGRFTLDSSLPLDRLSDEAARAALTPIEDALDWLPRIAVTQEQARDLFLGRNIALPAELQPAVRDPQPPLLCLTPDRRFIALGRAAADRLRPERIICRDE